MAGEEVYLVEKRADIRGCNDDGPLSPNHCHGVVDSSEDVGKQGHAGAE